jgi:hypothetical protein
MRLLAIVLVVLGCLGLVLYGFRPAGIDPGVPPAVAGIAVVCGLLLLTIAARRAA